MLTEAFSRASACNSGLDIQPHALSLGEGSFFDEREAQLSTLKMTGRLFTQIRSSCSYRWGSGPECGTVGAFVAVPLLLIGRWSWSTIYSPRMGRTSRCSVLAYRALPG